MYILRNSEVVTAEGLQEVDLFIKDGKIAKILERGAESEGEEIDCSGKTILPGLIDVHVHLRTPGHEYKEDWETGSKAAVAGGVTTVCDMPNNNPPILTVGDLENKRKLIEGKSYVNYGIYMGYDGSNIDEVNAAENVPAVKLYCTHSTGNMGSPEESFRTLFEKSNKLIVIHAEDHDCVEERYKKIVAEYEAKGEPVPVQEHSNIRASDCAAKSVRDMCKLMEETGARLHVAHTSCALELEVIEEYKGRGKLTCEVAPHHLFLSIDDYETLGNYGRMNPPLRTQADTFEMWKALKSGLVDIVATDHAPHTIEEKEVPYLEAPSGVPELDTLLPLMLNVVNDEGMTIEEMVDRCCTKPAELFNIQNKGKIAEGFDADIVVVDMDEEKKVQRSGLFTKCGWTPYEDMVLQGWPVMTFVNGNLVFKDGEFVEGPSGKEAQFS